MTTLEQFKKWGSTPLAKKLAIILAALVIILLTFQVGIIVGYHKAEFSFRFGNNYYRAFEHSERGGPMDRGFIPIPGFPSDLPGGHGAVGKIVKISLPTLTVIGPDNVEKIIITNDDTLVRQFREELKLDKLKVGDAIVTLGVPDSEGRVVAKLIRLMPAPINASSTNLSR